MNTSKSDTVVSPNPWFQEDYRNSSKFRGKHLSDVNYNSEDSWNSKKESMKDSQLNKYSLVIVLPPEKSTEVRDETSVAVQTDSGVASISPSPPKTPTPDYDSMEDFFAQDVDEIPSPTKKVHFSMSDDIDDDVPPTKTSKSSWRDALVDDFDYKDPLSLCYRQKWVNGESNTTPVRHYTSSTLPQDLETQGGRKSRTVRRRSGSSNRKLVRRTSSLDRYAELRFSYRKDRTPLVCDPDPLKDPATLEKRSPKHSKDSESSSHKPVERASCGPGPPLKQLRSYSVESNGVSQLGRARQRSVSGNVASKKTPVRRVDDEALKRSRLHSSQYELSQDLLDKQVEMLERKYGGVCARKAALTIQRAFRKYTIMKRFQDIANASKGEKRLSRRLPSFDVDAKEWAVYNGHPHQPPDADEHPKPCRTQSFRERRLNYHHHHNHHPQEVVAAYGRGYNNNNHHHHQEVNCYVEQAYPVSRSPPSFPRHPAWTAVPSQRTTAAVVHGQHMPSMYVNSSPGVGKVQPDGFQPTRDSVSSEDSALSSLSMENDSGDLDSSNLHRGTSTRHSLNVSPSKQHPHALVANAHLQRTAVRASDVALGRRVAAARADAKKVPPQVPKRTSSIPSRGEEGNHELDVVDGGGSNQVVASAIKSVEPSPVWKRKSLVLSEQNVSAEDKRLSNISENSEDSLDGGGGYSNTPPADMSHSFNVHNYPEVRTPHDLPGTAVYKLTEIQRKRQYRVGLNLFNKKPERGIRYLIQRGFLEASPQAVARFLLTRKGLSKQMIGEYLGNLQNSFNMAVLECFVQELDLAGMQVDVALRKFQTFFRMPGEAQKIERLVEVFSHRYIDCNHDIASKFHNADTVFVLAFAIIMLNTDLHTPNMKAERRMKLDEFIKNLRSIDDGHDLDRDMLVGIYERIKTNEFKMGSDHVTQVLKVQQTIVGKKPNLALPHRRLVCYCRLYEVYDVSKKERPGVHQREVFLFNDLLMVTKIFSKKKNSVTYTFRQSFPLCGMSVTLFEAPYYPHGIRLSQRVDDKVLITFNARNEHDRSKFVEDLKESILEMDEMENLRIEGELEKQKMMRVRGAENRDSGVADMEIIPQNSKECKLSPESASGSNNLKRSALSNSLLDLHEQQVNKPVRRGSAGSLDSGMSISFQSSAASSVSHDSSPQIVHASSTSSGSGSSLSSTRSGPDSAASKPPSGQAGFLGGLFGKKGKHSSKSSMRKTLDGSET